MNKQLIGFIILLSIVIISACNKDVELSEAMKETFYLRNGGSDMPVFVRGNGLSKKFIILLHGGPGDTSTDYMNENFSIQLQNDYAFAFWDQRQQGNSHGHLKPEDISLAQIVEDTYYLVKTLKYRYGDEIEIYLMGHSWGGTVGTAFLQTNDYQNEVAGFIEISGGYDFPEINKNTIAMMQHYGQIEIDKGNKVNEWEEILEYANSLNPESLTKDEMLELNSYAGKIERERLIEEIYTIPSNNGFKEEEKATENSVISTTMNAVSIFFKLDLIDELITISLTENLHKITVPTLLIWGKYDFKVPSILGETAYENIGSSQKTLNIYEHSGHNSMKFDADRFVNDVRVFID